MRKVLVTGGAGMIGSNLVRVLALMGDDVYVVDNLWRGKLDYLRDDDGKEIIDFKTRFYNRDLSIAGSCDDLVQKVDYVVHLADVVAGIDFVFDNQGLLFRQNLLINSNVINSARKAKGHLKGFLYAGTACSFPETRQNSLVAIPLKEEELYPAQPESAYGWSKLMGQYETELMGAETGIPVCNLMFHNVYGTPCDYGKRSQVIPALIRKAINFPDEPFVVWGSGNQGRAFIHVDDVVHAIILALEKGLDMGVIQIGPSISTSIREIAEMVVEISGKSIEIVYDTTKPEGDKARSADFSKAQKVLGWSPQISLKEGLEKQYMWVKSAIENKEHRHRVHEKIYSIIDK
ncbi:MAG TPA: NAD-dependent epimerase/dehydratase family protein [Marinilabiliaceae bacterium]|nr:NAD-dependent epimerase/dehydratase family protein [Marinilabiliaceae bacterium]